MDDATHRLTILKIPQSLRETLKLTKTYACPTPGAKLIRTEYSAGIRFEFNQTSVPDIHAFAALHEKMLAVPYACVIRGEPIPGLNPTNAQRLLTNFPDTPRAWLYVDFDEPTLPRGADGAQAARALLPEAFHNAPCLWARTGSYGVDYEGREDDDDPWRSRIRLGFMLDTPLDAPRIKRWLRHHQCDLAIYTANQITYTANPLFADGAIDPVLAAGEERFGTLDLDDALVDEVIVPSDIADWIPTASGTGVTTRPACIAEHKHAELLREADECDAEEGERHGTVTRWIYDAYGLGMDETEIVTVAARTLVRLGRSIKAATPEAQRCLIGAQRKMSEGTLWVSSHFQPGRDFEPVDTNDSTTTTITPAAAAAQSQELIQWWQRLKISPSTGAFKASLSNAAIILANHSSMLDDTGACILAYDAFQDRPVWTAPPPWWRSRPGKANPIIGKLGVAIQDDDAVALSVWLGHLDPASGNEGTPIDIQPSTCANALHHVARYRTVNPAQAYLDACAEGWDGEKRLHTVLKDVCRSETDPKLLAKWFPNWLVQAVARVYKPGTKCDAVLVFQGGEGAKKSSFFRTLCPFPEWFIDDLPSVQDKDSMQILRGKMIVELAEMFAARKADIDKLKGFLTKQDDTFRASYGREDHRRPRTCVFCASANEEDCLTDAAGRRWWVVATPSEKDIKVGKRIQLAQVEAMRDQWWGEAVHLYRSGHEWWLNYDDEKAARQIALSHSAGMEQALDILRWLSLPSDKGGPPNPDIVLSKEIWVGALGRSSSTWHPASGREINKLMKGLPNYTHEVFSIRIGPATKTFRAYVRVGSKMSLDIKARNEYMSIHDLPSSDGDDNP